ITGLSNSISRAVIMITVYELTELFSSRKYLLRALAISALITTLFNPAAPFQIGFQLSYSAVTAICFLYPRMKGLLRVRSALMEYIWNGLSLSICCQAATAPLAYLYFGTFPRYFMITNLAAIPITGIVMYTIPVALCLKPLRPVLFWSLSLLNRLIHTVAGMGT
ncbi:MAG: ComEC/Rec2 family competence protein, partial [Bacteroidales bacterium]|nr:ComEC/Rec2 family competence protein [Bacteroidales bacterium]